MGQNRWLMCLELLQYCVATGTHTQPQEACETEMLS